MTITAPSDQFMTLDHHPSPLEPRTEATQAVRESMLERYAELITKPSPTPGDGLELAQLAERLGFDEDLVGEHHRAITNFVESSRIGTGWPAELGRLRQLLAEETEWNAEHDAYMSRARSTHDQTVRKISEAQRREDEARKATFRALQLRRQYPWLIREDLLTADFRRSVDVVAGRETGIPAARTEGHQ